jgi:heme o synthase
MNVYSIARRGSSSLVVRPARMPAAVSPNLTATPHDWWVLSKGHLSVWVALSALPGYLVAAPWDPVGIACVLGGTSLASAASQALNQRRESDRDSRMKRTRNRPVPMGRISPDDAKKFACISALSGSAILTAASGSLAPAVIAMSTIGLYVNVYTPMKTRSPYNTHIGAIAGSLPVMIGFACAGGFPIFISPEPWVLLGLQTVWQFPHFYPLAWMYRADYKEGGYKMFPLDDESGNETARMCAPYMVALCMLPFGAAAVGASTWMYPVTASVVNALWIKTYMSFRANPTKKTARTYFLGSLWYLILAMGAYVIHLKPMHEPDWRDQMKKRFKAMCFHENVANDCHVPNLCPSKKLDIGKQ